MSTFKCQPTNNQPAFDIVADRAETEPNSGAVLFYNGDQLVAKQLNISFRKVEETPPE